MRLSKKKAIEYSILIAFCAFAITLPIISGAKSYPLAVVEGNSMYPNLQNGDLVYYGGINPAQIMNGTVIVFVQGETGMPLLDGLIKPIVIHRVVGQIVQADGTVCYETKGDNNDEKDPALVRGDHVLGAAMQNIPKAGLLLLFVKSPQGLIATVGLITIGYLSLFEAKRKQRKQKEAFLGVLAQKTLNGDLSEGIFKKIELAVNYSQEIEDNKLRPDCFPGFLKWLKEDGLNKEWKIRTVECHVCSRKSVIIETENKNLPICATCGIATTARQGVLINLRKAAKILDTLLMESVDEVLSSLGKTSKDKMYLYLKEIFKIKKREIPHRLDDFSKALERFFGPGAKHLEKSLVKKLRINIENNLDCPMVENPVSEGTFANFVDHIRQSFKAEKRL